MTASEKVAVKSAQKASFGKVLTIQIAAYVVLVVLALIPGIPYGNTEEPAIDPYGEGWIFKIELEDDEPGLLSSEEYANIVAE